MRRARVRHQGAIHDVIVETDGVLRTSGGDALREEDVTWLPPKHGTILALGLNYRDHAAELDFKPPDEPLLFFKSVLEPHWPQAVLPLGPTASK